MSQLPAGTADRAIARLRAAGAGNDPVGWARDRLAVYPWSGQRKILESIRDHRHTAVQSAHGTGKTFTAGTAVCWWLDSHPIGEAFVVTTSATAAQVEGQLWREIGRLHSKADLPGWITGGPAPMWKIAGEIYGIGRKPADDDREGLAGYHARYLLVVIDEASGVPVSLFDQAESLATNEHARILAIGNPIVPGSHFAKICAPGSGWNRIKISAFDLPAFTGEQVPADVADHLIGPTWVEERRKRWGESSPAYVSRVLGEFPTVNDDTLIRPEWIAAAQDRDLNPEEHAAVLGVDVGGGGGKSSDRTVIYRARGGVLRFEHEARDHDLMRTAGEVHRRLRNNGTAAYIDVVGIGQGVYDACSEQGLNVSRFHSAERARDPQRFYNRRAQAYWELREAFERGAIDLDPLDEDVAAELGALRWKLDGRRGLILIESKDDMRKRGVASPDRADAACIAFAGGRTGRSVRAWRAGLTDAERWRLDHPLPPEGLLDDSAMSLDEWWKAGGSLTAGLLDAEM